MSDKLVVYYSRANENYVSGQLRRLEIGNTQKAADIIARHTGADEFKIEQQNPYSENYNECIAQAQEDQRKDARPALKEYPENLDKYSVIFLGYPNYWSTMPMAVFTFLENTDLSGKTICPFCSHEGSGLGSSIKDIKKLCPSAKIVPGLAIHGTNVERFESKIIGWLKSPEVSGNENSR